MMLVAAVDILASSPTKVVRWIFLPKISTHARIKASILHVTKTLI